MDQTPKTIVTTFLDHGYLLSPDILHPLNIGSLDKEVFLNKTQQFFTNKQGPLVLTLDVSQAIIQENTLDINWTEFEKTRVLSEKKRNQKSYTSFLQVITKKRINTPPTLPQPTPPSLHSPLPSPEQQPTHSPLPVIITKSYTSESKHVTVKDFVSYFKHRYEFLSNILKPRPELSNVISISRLTTHMNPYEPVAIIGSVYDKILTKSKNYLFTIEDPTGRAKVLVSQSSKDLYTAAKNTTYDEIIGVTGTIKNNLLFADSLLYPDIPTPQTLKRAPDESYAVFISDIHVGSKLFKEKEFLAFITWLNGETGDKNQQTLVKKIKYLFIAGDLVAGVGVYPGQQENLAIPNIHDQYAALTHYLHLIRKDIALIICPGNHDAVSLSEPQPPILNEFSEPLRSLSHAHFVSSPSYITIHKTDTFDGFSVLLYHGSSFHYYMSSVDELLKADAKNNPAPVWKYLLKRRHLAPTHGSTRHFPTSAIDYFLIDKVPDIVVNGDIHKSGFGEYHGTLIICSSCWEDITPFQIKVGNKPDPCHVPLLNLHTREVTILDFTTPL